MLSGDGLGEGAAPPLQNPAAVGAIEMVGVDRAATSSHDAAAPAGNLPGLFDGVDSEELDSEKQSGFIPGSEPQDPFGLKPGSAELQDRSDLAEVPCAATEGVGQTRRSPALAGPSDAYSFEIPNVLTLSFLGYSTVSQNSGADPFAQATNAVLQLSQFGNLGPITLSTVSLFGSADAITGFEVLNLSISTSGSIGSSTYKLLDFANLTVAVTNLKATKVNDTWGLDAATVGLHAASATLLPDEPDLTASITGFNAAIDVTNGSFSATGAAAVNVKDRNSTRLNSSHT